MGECTSQQFYDGKYVAQTTHNTVWYQTGGSRARSSQHSVVQQRRHIHVGRYTIVCDGSSTGRVRLRSAYHADRRRVGYHAIVTTEMARMKNRERTGSLPGLRKRKTQLAVSVSSVEYGIPCRHAVQQLDIPYAYLQAHVALSCAGCAGCADRHRGAGRQQTKTPSTGIARLSAAQTDGQTRMGHHAADLPPAEPQRKTQ